jgi:transposase
VAPARSLEEANERIAQLEALVAELLARLGRNSRNSDKPPSADPPDAAQPPKAPSGRKRGGQPGHQRHEAALLPPGRVTARHDVRPTSCWRCGGSLHGRDPHPACHQVIDVPPVQATAEEWLLHTLVCDRCGASNRGELPAGVPTLRYGPRLTALVAVFAGAYRLSARLIQGLVGDLFGVRVSLGMIPKLQDRASEAMAAPAAEAAEHVRAAPRVFADETGWTEDKKRAWLWVALTRTVAAFAIRRSRSAKVAKELLGAGFGGLLHSDRWASYDWVAVGRRQLCWAHLVRQFRGFEELGGAAAPIGRALGRACRRMFRHWNRVRDGTLSRSGFALRMRPIERRVVKLLRRGASSGLPRVAGRCREILVLEDALFTFVREADVEPTNNRAERALRHAVIWRKASFGTDSERGSRFVERVLTAVTSLRLQGRNVLEWVTSAYRALLMRRPVPSLLPQPQAAIGQQIAA